MLSKVRVQHTEFGIFGDGRIDLLIIGIIRDGLDLLVSSGEGVVLDNEIVLSASHCDSDL